MYASPQVPLLPALVHHKILSVSCSDTANPCGLCLALQVRSAEPAAAWAGRSFLGWWEGCPAPCWATPQWELAGAPHHRSRFSPQPWCRVPRAELLPGWGGKSISGKSEGIKKCWGTAQNNIFWVTSGSCRQESSRQKGDKKMQCREMVFASGTEEEEGYCGQGQCQDTTYWCCCYQFVLGFGQII